MCGDGGTWKLSVLWFSFAVKLNKTALRNKGD